MKQEKGTERPRLLNYTNLPHKDAGGYAMRGHRQTERPPRRG
jgi:hypothetical protein